MLKKVKIEEAIGMTLAHDVTKIVPGSFKGPAFKRGHVIKVEDIPDFKSIGKEHIYIMSLGADEVHEEEAAVRIAQAVAGTGLKQTGPSEGRINLIATGTGLVRINAAGLDEINSLGEMIIATLHDATVVKEGTCVAGMRITPLYIDKVKLVKMEGVARRYRPVVTLAPFKHKNVGLVITGNEVFKGTIKDAFAPVMRRKVEALGCIVNNQAFVPDDSDVVARTIKEFQAGGSEIVLCCSGMSVDPDDVTVEGIRKSGADVRFYGLPVLPGAMFLYANLNGMHILGVPACAIHAPTTAFDILFPRVLTGEKLEFATTRDLGHGGLCLGCKECAYPKCPFGK
jgi:hypothetical protein